MGTPDLRLVDPHDDGICGAECADGTPCQRPAGEDGRCWSPAHRDSPTAGPEPPEYLGEYGKQEWRNRVAELVSAGKLGAVDMGLLESLCDVYQEVRACRKHVDEHGRTVAGRGDSVKKNPAHSKLLKFRKEYRLCANDLRDMIEKAGRDETDDGESESGWSDW